MAQTTVVQDRPRRFQWCRHGRHRFSCALVFVVLLASTRAAQEVRLSTVIDPSRADTEFARPVLDQNVNKHPMTIAERKFGHGVGVQANTTMAVAVNGATRLQGWAGVDDESHGAEAIHFEIRADGVAVWVRELRAGQPAEAIELDLRGRKTLVLVIGVLR